MTVYTHDYQDTSFDHYWDSVERFEREAGLHLRGLAADDVGGVVVYRDQMGSERAWFDYEVLVGSVLALGGSASCEDC